MVTHWVGSLRNSITKKCPTGRPQLRFKDVRKRDLRTMNIDLNTWEASASERQAWRQTVQKGKFEETLAQQSEAKRLRRRPKTITDRPVSDFTCSQCGKDCHC